MAMDFMSQGILARLAAENPQAFAEMAAAKGLQPPAVGAPTGLGGGLRDSLAGLLDPAPQGPLAGVTAPPAPDAPNVSTPGAPRPSQAIDMGSNLIDLLLKSQGAAAPPPPLSLASFLGR